LQKIRWNRQTHCYYAPDYSSGMSAITSVSAISATASSVRVGLSSKNAATAPASTLLPTAPDTVAGLVTAAAATAAPVSNNSPTANHASAATARGPARTDQVAAIGTSIGGAPTGSANVAPTSEPRSPYKLTNGVPPSSHLASQMTQQLVAFYPFPTTVQTVARTVDIKT
jgi:hypothetical protein